MTVTSAIVTTVPVYTILMHAYKSNYADLQFERAGLFKAIQEKYGLREALYPGCSIHITPSLYFPHVVYVDQSESAAEFFANEKPILDFVNRSKHYKQSAYFRFIRADYSQPLPLREKSFDMLLALFAGGITAPCYRYVKVGGYLLTNNHRGDANDAVQIAELHLVGKCVYEKHTYRISECVHVQEIIKAKPNDKFLRQTQQGIRYSENETYYIFQRVH